MKVTLREKIRRLATRNVPEGSIYPAWVVCVMACLYPTRYLRYKLGNYEGYQFQYDTWLIEGVRYTGEAMRTLANSAGGTYKIVRHGDTITVERT